MTKEPDEHLTNEEAARRRDEVVKRMLATPPQPRTAKPKSPSPKAQKASRRA